MRRGYYCYKWVLGDAIVYVGKTVSPRDRIAQERRQEKLLINKYQPELNVQDTHEAFSEIPLDNESMEWIPLDIPACGQAGDATHFSFIEPLVYGPPWYNAELFALT